MADGRPALASGA